MNKGSAKFIMMEGVKYSGSRNMVVMPVMVAKKDGQAEPPKPVEGHDGVFEIGIVSRSEGRQEDIMSKWNSFETGLIIGSVPPGFRLVFYDHPTIQASGYSLLCPKIYAFSPDAPREPLAIDLFKLTEQEQLDLPCSAILVKIEPIYTFSMPMKAKPEDRQAPVSSRKTRKSRKTYSSSEDEEPRSMVRRKKVW